MRPAHLTMMCILLTSVGCGPNVASFFGRYNVQIDEQISACTRAAPASTVLIQSTSIRISEEGTDWDLFVDLGDCRLKANVQDNTRFTVQTQSCAASLDDETARVTLEGEGTVVDDQLEMSLAGAYSGTDSFGIVFTCTYALTVMPSSL